jgi:hypothetical protein
MGRWKKSKSRRQRPDPVSLREEYGAVLNLDVLTTLEPPGELYKTIIDMSVFADVADLDTALAGVPEDAQERTARLQRLGELYGAPFPEAALLLDTMLDLGTLPVRDNEIEIGIKMVPLRELANDLGRTGADPQEARELLHLVHAGGLLLVDMEAGESGERPVPVLRMVVEQPTAPGVGRWRFMDETGPLERERMIDKIERTARGMR